jgi:hypothetical protein
MRWPPAGIIPRPIAPVAQRLLGPAPGPDFDRRVGPHAQVQRPHVRPQPTPLHLADPFDFLRVVVGLLDRPAIQRRRDDRRDGGGGGVEERPPGAVLLPEDHDPHHAAGRSPRRPEALEELGDDLARVGPDLDGLPTPPLPGRSASLGRFLPHLGPEGVALYRQFRLNEPWDSPHNRPLLDRMPAVYACPDEPRGRPPTTNYLVDVRPGRVFTGGREGVKIEQLTGGTVNTLMVFESDQLVPWTAPDEVSAAPSEEGPGMGSRHPGGYHVAMADGTVRTGVPPAAAAPAARPWRGAAGGKLATRPLRGLPPARNRDTPDRSRQSKKGEGGARHADREGGVPGTPYKTVVHAKRSRRPRIFRLASVGRGFTVAFWRIKGLDSRQQSLGDNRFLSPCRRNSLNRGKCSIYGSRSKK